MSKAINLLNQAKQLRNDSYSISLGDGQITVYEPINKFKEAAPGQREDNFKTTPQPHDPLRILMVLTVILGVFVVLHSYLLFLNTRQHIIMMNKAFENLNENQTALQKEIQSFQDDIKNTSINTAFQINSLETDMGADKKRF